MSPFSTNSNHECARSRWVGDSLWLAVVMMSSLCGRRLGELISGYLYACDAPGKRNGADEIKDE
jgi:hypothetical protein